MACSICLKTKAGLECGICHNSVCKTCAQFLDEDSFSFLKVIPEELTCSAYCPHCFDEKVAGQLTQYTETMERAKNINVFLKNQSKESRPYKSEEPPFTVEDCPDAEEALLRLAFFAVQSNFNGLVNVDIYSKKVRDGNYQTHLWSGTGIPTHIYNERVLRNKGRS